MCGIFAFILAALAKKDSKDRLSIQQKIKLQNEFTKILARGPDNSLIQEYADGKIYFGFHRLSIMDTSSKGNQPMQLNQLQHIVLICNGEIFNFKQLIRENQFQTETGSDCEVIIHMYHKYGIHKTIEQLDGDFAFVLYDMQKSIIYAGRDPLGVRALYYGTTETGDMVFASEVKAIDKLATTVKPFPPGQYWTSETKQFSTYYDYKYPTMYSEEMSTMTTIEQEEFIMSKIRDTFISAVDKRLMSDRPIGCLLSGGLDSSLVAALVAQKFQKNTLHTFSIGLEGSEDLKFARIVADYVGTIHHEVVVTQEDMLNFLEKDIYQIETFDTTTIRASTPMLMLCHYIKKNTDITVIYSGEGSDEASGSYLYFHNAPTPQDFQTETIRLLKDLHRFDVLRCDKSTAGAGLEVRVPFLDKSFLQFYMQIKPELKQARSGMEKFLLRKSFESLNLLPKSVLWRTKEGFSDGCSSKAKSWYKIIQEYVETQITDEQFEKESKSYTHCPPKFKEALFYRKIFNKYYQDRDELIPYYWLPKWSGDVSEPSARVLKIYSACEKLTTFA